MRIQFHRNFLQTPPILLYVSTPSESEMQLALSVQCSKYIANSRHSKGSILYTSPIVKWV